MISSVVHINLEWPSTVSKGWWRPSTSMLHNTDPSLLCQGVHIVDLHSTFQSTRETTCVCMHGGSFKFEYMYRQFLSIKLFIIMICSPRWQYQVNNWTRTLVLVKAQLQHSPRKRHVQDFNLPPQLHVVASSLIVLFRAQYTPPDQN